MSDKDLGPTPPNVYNLSLREKPFHGVRAIRLFPAGGGNMFGRDGFLAHSYMRGPHGQSSGCVSFSNYPAFLHAYLAGEINRIVVVEHLQMAPSSKIVAARMVTPSKLCLGHCETSWDTAGAQTYAIACIRSSRATTEGGKTFAPSET